MVESDMSAGVEPRPYHHGNLPEVLAVAADALVREQGVHAFSLRECARRAGVAHSAPGHHYGDVTGLLGEVAARGFDRLTARMRAERGGATGALGLERIGRGYVGFALEDPVVFGLMFHSDRVDHASRRLKTAGDRAFAELVAAVAASSDAGEADPDTLRFAWAGVHGIATLLIAGAEGRACDVLGDGDPALAEGVIRRIVHTVVHHRD